MSITASAASRACRRSRRRARRTIAWSSITPGGDRLFLPVENIELLTRYGSEETEVQLDRLGGVGWQARKARMKQRIREMAGALMKIAAARVLKDAPRLVPPEGLYDEFCARFPYEETEDQLNAIEAVLDDLGVGSPDGPARLRRRRLRQDRGGAAGRLRGRDGRQAGRGRGADDAPGAPALPYLLGALPRVCRSTSRKLSRFVSGAEQKKVKQGLADGTVDIVVGTHALLGKAIEFRDLDLIVVDEEQHFGVGHKERLKELRAEVHVLTLSATPIPRTLQLALTGVRELSIIATPPVDRLAVRTFVTPFDPLIIREALLRERYRGGQAFYVVPRIEDLAEVKSFLDKEMPEAKVAVAHGQMAAGQLEDVMTAFYEGKFDILLSTTIVESGLDIPTANTLIVHRADMFGLAQLYQLRGRVGRSKTRAYALFTMPANRTLTVQAERRLKVLQSLDTLGAGFQLASHDLDIRGAGNLLGDEQSGHIKEVGYELYQQMLEEAVAALKAGVEETGGGAVVADHRDRRAGDDPGELRRRTCSCGSASTGACSTLETDAEIEAFGAELIDRFGPLPTEVAAASEDHGDQGAVPARQCREGRRRPEGRHRVLPRQRLRQPGRASSSYVAEQGSFAKVRPDMKIVFIRDVEEPDERLKTTAGILRHLARIAERKQAA